MYADLCVCMYACMWVYCIYMYTFSYRCMYCVCALSWSTGNMYDNVWVNVCCFGPRGPVSMCVCVLFGTLSCGKVEKRARESRNHSVLLYNLHIHSRCDRNSFSQIPFRVGWMLNGAYAYVWDVWTHTLIMICMWTKWVEEGGIYGVYRCVEMYINVCIWWYLCICEYMYVAGVNMCTFGAFAFHHHHYQHAWCCFCMVCNVKQTLFSSSFCWYISKRGGHFTSLMCDCGTFSENVKTQGRNKDESLFVIIYMCVWFGYNTQYVWRLEWWHLRESQVYLFILDIRSCVTWKIACFVIHIYCICLQWFHKVSVFLDGCMIAWFAMRPKVCVYINFTPNVHFASERTACHFIRIMVWAVLLSGCTLLCPQWYNLPYYHLFHCNAALLSQMLVRGYIYIFLCTQPIFVSSYVIFCVKLGCFMLQTILCAGRREFLWAKNIFADSHLYTLYIYLYVRMRVCSSVKITILFFDSIQKQELA